jgi:hypothetical protein
MTGVMNRLACSAIREPHTPRGRRAGASRQEYASMPNRFPATRAGFPPAPELPEPWKTAHQVALDLLLTMGWAAFEAACFCGQRPADPLAVPPKQRDVDGGESQPTRYGVLGLLAELCILSDLSGRQGELLEAALPHLARSRADRAEQPVRVGLVTGKTVAEAVQRAALAILSTVERSFGCGQFIKIVSGSFPRDVEADPWEINLALGWYETTRQSPGAAEHVAGLLSGQSEFLRRLFTWPLRQALDSVRLDELCRWLHEKFSGLDVPWLREHLEIEFVRAASESPPSFPGANKQIETGPPPEAEEWLPASKAVDRAQRAGLKVTTSWLSKLRTSGKPQEIKMRPPVLPGTHRFEVEWNSLAGCLGRRMTKGTEGEDPDVQRRLEKAREMKSRSRSLD